MDALALLCCPVSQQPLRVAPPALVVALQALVRQRALRNEAAQLIDTPFDGAWVTADHARAWLVRDGCADFMPGSAVLLHPDDFTHDSLAT